MAFISIISFRSVGYKRHSLFQIYRFAKVDPILRYIHHSKWGNGTMLSKYLHRYRTLYILIARFNLY